MLAQTEPGAPETDPALQAAFSTPARLWRHAPVLMTPAPADSPRRRVLVVEDDDAIRELLRLHLALAGLEVVDVADGNRALALARSAVFDLIVLDVMLPRHRWDHDVPGGSRRMCGRRMKCR